MGDTGGTGSEEELISVGQGYHIGDRIIHDVHGPGVIMDSYDPRRGVLAKFDNSTSGGHQLASFTSIRPFSAGTGETAGKRRRHRKTRKTKSKKSTRRRR